MPWNAYTRRRASRIGLRGCRTVGEWLPRFHWRASQVVTGAVACAPPAPLSIVHGRSRASAGLRGPPRAFRGSAVTLFLIGGRLECGRGDSDAARMADDRVLPPLIADETGAAGTAEQGCQGDAREFCHGWSHNIILDSGRIPAGRWNTTAVPSRTARVSRSHEWQRTCVRSRLPPASARHGSTVWVTVLSGWRRRGPSTDAAQLPLASAVRSSDTHRR